MAVTAKISELTHVALKQLAKQTGKPMQLVLEEAVESYRRQKFFDDLDRQVLATQADPKAWDEELAERTLWEAPLADGSED